MMKPIRSFLSTTLALLACLIFTACGSAVSTSGFSKPVPFHPGEVQITVYRAITPAWPAIQAHVYNPTNVVAKLLPGESYTWFTSTNGLSLKVLAQGQSIDGIELSDPSLGYSQVQINWTPNTAYKFKVTPIQGGQKIPRPAGPGLLVGGLFRIDLESVTPIAAAGSQTSADSKMLILKGWDYLRKKDSATALSYFRQAEAANSNDSETYHGLAAASADLNRPKGEVIGFFQKAVSIQPVSSNTYTDYGRYVWMQGDPNTALILINHALQIDPNTPEARRHIATIYGDIGRQKEACDWAKSAAQNRDSDGEILVRKYCTNP